MKAWVLHGINDLRYEDINQPVPIPGEALIQVRAAGICGSDIPRIFHTGAHRHPLIPGHEFSDIVVEVGSAADCFWLGKRVGVFPLIPCSTCSMCQQKHYELCSNYDYLGSRRDGGFAEYVAVPIRNLLELPDTVNFEKAAMLEPLSVAAHAMRRTELKHRDAIAVCGMGPIGMSLLLLLYEAGYTNLYVIGNKESQKRRLSSLNIPMIHYCDSTKTDVVEWLTDQGGIDAFFECTGTQACVRTAILVTDPLGKIILVGNPTSDIVLPKDIYWRALRRQLTIKGSWNSSFTGEDGDDWHYVLSKLSRDIFAVDNIISHKFMLDQLPDALNLIKDKKDACKVLLMMTGERCML